MLRTRHLREISSSFEAATLGISETAAPYTGGTWTWQWSGSNGNNIYIGVDQTWYSGGSWTRPILTGDNPLTPNPGVQGDSVASCGHQIGNSNNIWVAQVVSYYTLDNFEMTGFCSNTPNQPNGHDDYVDNNGSQYTLIENVYIHGWTHVALGGSMQVNIKAFEGGSAGISPDQQVGETYSQVVVDGADSDPAGAEANQFDGWYDVEYSVFRNVTQVVYTLAHNFHDNLMEYFYWAANAGHQNVFEADREWDGPTNVFYNNIFRHIYPQGSGGNVMIWPSPPVGTTDYWFNNLIYDANAPGNYFNIGQNGGDQGTLDIFNNTFELPSGGGGMIDGCTPGSAHPYNLTNNHYVTDSSPYGGSCVAGTTEMTMNHSTATADGYTAAQTFAYSPTSNGSPTVGAGTNKQSYCTTLLASSDAAVKAAGTACQSDTTYSCTYETSNHTVSCPAKTLVGRPASGAWNVAAYEYGSQGAATESHRRV